MRIACLALLLACGTVPDRGDGGAPWLKPDGGEFAFRDLRTRGELLETLGPPCAIGQIFLTDQVAETWRYCLASPTSVSCADPCATPLVYVVLGDVVFLQLDP